MDRSDQQSRARTDHAVTRGTGAAGGAGLAGMGVQFVVAILVFLFLGKWLDSRIGTTPWLMILGVFVGATGGTIAMYRRAFPPEKTGSKPPAGPKPSASA